MQRLRDKLSVSERTAKAEAQLKVKFDFEKFQSFCFLIKANQQFVNAVAVSNPGKV